MNFLKLFAKWYILGVKKSDFVCVSAMFLWVCSNKLYSIPEKEH